MSAKHSFFKSASYQDDLLAQLLENPVRTNLLYYKSKEIVESLQKSIQAQPERLNKAPSEKVRKLAETLAKVAEERRNYDLFKLSGTLYKNSFSHEGDDNNATAFFDYKQQVEKYCPDSFTETMQYTPEGVAALTKATVPERHFNAGPIEQPTPAPGGNKAPTLRP